MKIGLINHSTHLKAGDLALIAQALQYQMTNHAAPLWDTKPATVSTYASESQMAADVKCLIAFDNADQAGALGYHDETPTGGIYGKVFVKTILDYGGSTLRGDLSVAATFSHEALEMWRDPYINEWAQGPDGRLYARELGDPVEGDYYDVVVSGKYVSVSNFVLPAWFDAAKLPNHPKYDYMGKLTAPFSMTAGGYMIVQTGGQTSAVYGAEHSEHKRAMKFSHPASRTCRRAVPKP